MVDIIADFHGTLYQDPDEGPLWEHMAIKAIMPPESLRHPLRTVQIALAKGTLEGLAERYERGEIGYDQIYEAYNRLVLSHLSIDFVRAAIVNYAAMPETKQKLDHRLLVPINAVSGKKGILSTGSRGFIQLCLDSSDHSFPRSYIVANDVVRQGNGTEFVLRVYGNKPQMIEKEFFGPRKFDPKRTVYLGDNKDEEPAFEYVTSNGGRVVVPFYATDAFKQHAASKYKAEVPNNQQELSRFLQSLRAS